MYETSKSKSDQDKNLLLVHEDAPRLMRLSDAEGTREIPTQWKRREDITHPVKNVHFLVLPAYARYNDQAPLSPAKGIRKGPRRDLLFFPLGYAQVISSLRQFTNHRIEVFDPYARYVGMDDLPKWLESEYAARGLASPDYVLIGGMSTSWPVIKQAVSAVKRTFPSARIVCGGTVAGLHYELLLRKLGVDIAVIGEAEFIAADLFHSLSNYRQVPGIAFLDESGKVVKNPSSPPHDLNDAPEPAWDSFDVYEYVESGKRNVGYRGLPINTSMGCPFTCKFCYVPGGRKMRYLSTDNVVDRMQRLKDRFDVDYIGFYDDILFVDKGWMQELGEKLLKARVKVVWNCSSRVDLFKEKDAPLLRLLRRAGLVRIAFGIESGSPAVLKNMGKTGVSPEKSRATLRLVREAGIRGTANMILGFPGETPETIQETVEFCKDNLLHPSFYLLQPFPGTDVYDKYVRERYDEEAYLELMADYREGEQLPINLTSIPDHELIRLREKAEQEMKRFYLGRYVRYYGWHTPRHAVRDAWNEAHRRIRGSVFPTP